MADPAPKKRPAEPRRTDTRDPRGARTRALKILFQADVRDASASAVLEALAEDVSARAMLDDVDELDETQAPAVPARRPAGEVAPIDGFTRTLVTGVEADRATIDALISRYARRWQIPRMPVVDRTVLRVATFELLHESTPPAVVIDEAVRLAKALSTDDSGRYVNGVLESIRKDLAARGSASSGA